MRRRLRRTVAAVAAGCLVVSAAALLLAVWRSRLEAPPPTLLLRDRHGRFLDETGEVGEAEGFGYWPLDAVPPRVAAAIVAVEDRRFWRHPGVDLWGVGRALVQNLRSGRRVSGASTLAMQVARLQHPGPRTYPRKAVEALTALFLTARYGRSALLRHYLTIVPYGDRIHGVVYAARRYFDKPVADLSWAETAFLAAIPQAPARMNPFDPRGKGRAIRRGLRILDLLHDSGTLAEEEYRVARHEIRRLPIPPRDRRPEEALHAVLRLSARVAARPPAERGAPIVDTTLDLDLQREVAWRVAEAVDRWEARGAGNAALLVVERGSWAVRAAVSSAGYFDDRRAGSIDYLTVPRSAGSTLKPFLYALALDRGVITPATVLDDLDRGPGGIGNSDGRFLGPLLPRASLANSRNVPAVGLLAAVGQDELYALLGALGLHDGARPAGYYGAGLALGSLPVTLERLVGAYTVLAGDGRLHQLRWLQDEAVAPPRRLVSEAAARQVSLFLSDPQARLPTFPRMGASEYPFAVAVKTGTSTGYRDAWTVAYSSRYLVGVWVGHPDLRPMAGLSGYRSAAHLAHEVLALLHPDQQEGLDALPFPPPRGYRAERLCALSGLRATPACDRVSLEWLAPGRQVVAACPFHRFVAVDRRDGRPATGRTPRRDIEVRAIAELPPRYAAWALATGVAAPRGPSPAEPGASAAPPRASFEPPVRIAIAAPEDGLHLLQDPETPAGASTLALRAVVDPPVEQVVWYVDGHPFRTVDRPFTARWPLAPGEHRFEARLPFGGERSGVVRVLVE